ncbi:MAG: sugar transferase [Vicinamibacteria bacterium]
MDFAEHRTRLPRLGGLEDAVHGLDDRTLELLDGRRTARLSRRGWLVRRMLLGADVIGLVLSFFVAQVLTRSPASTDHIGVLSEYALLLVVIPVWILAAKLYGLYDRDEEHTDHSTVYEFTGVLYLVTIGVWLAQVVTWTTEAARPPLPKLLVFWMFAVGFIVIGRALARAYCHRQTAYLQNAVIVGGGDVGQLVARKILNHPEYGINIVGFVDDQPRPRRTDLDSLALLGDLDELAEVIDLLDVERVIIAFSNDPHEEILNVVRSLKDRDIQIDIVPRFFEVVGANVGIHMVEGLPLVGLPPLRLSRSSRLLKRSMDLALSALGALVLAPILLVIAVVIRLDSPGPVLFRQERVGARDAKFRIFKFRTMAVDADERKHEVTHLNMHAVNGGDPRMFKIPDDPRITRVGKILRRYSLDELPQLLNVIRGEMSLVGPRPLIPDEDRWVKEWARKRLNLKPGVTGLWQTLGASDIPFEEMTKLDYLYVTNWTLWGDVQLIFRTIPSLCRTRHAY